VLRETSNPLLFVYFIPAKIRSASQIRAYQPLYRRECNYLIWKADVALLKGPRVEET
jgi:hypothetical protein